MQSPFRPVRAIEDESSRLRRRNQFSGREDSNGAHRELNLTFNYCCFCSVGKSVCTGLRAVLHSAAESTTTSGGVSIRFWGPNPKWHPRLHAPALRAV